MNKHNDMHAPQSGSGSQSNETSADATGANEVSDNHAAPEEQFHEVSGTLVSATQRGRPDETAGPEADANDAVTVPPPIVFPFVPRRRRGSDGRHLTVAPESTAAVAASNGAGWSVAQACKDSPRSKQYGVTLRAAMRELGIGDFEAGALVKIEIGVGIQRFVMTGRASRKSAVYFPIAHFVEAGIAPHVPFHVTILNVEPENNAAR